MEEVDAMIERVKATINKFSMIDRGDRVLAGVSGGPDSIALTHILKRLSGEIGFEVVVAHLNHCLRGHDSAEDAEFVRNFAKEMALEAVIEERDVSAYALQKKMSIQEAAREVRYSFFKSVAKRTCCNKLATGHNANDQAETIIFNFLRGSGSAGLGGIPPVRDDWIIRPLIRTMRSDIENYCKTNGLKTRLDKSNLKSYYTRNKIRLELIPFLEREFNANLVNTLLRSGEVFREEEEYLESLAINRWGQVCLNSNDKFLEFNLDSFLALPPVLQRRIIRRAWLQLADSGQNLSFKNSTEILQMLREGNSGSMLNLPLGVVLTKSYGKFVLSSEAPEKAPGFEYVLKVPGLTVIPETGLAIYAEISDRVCPFLGKTDRNEVFLDYDLLGFPVRVRNRKPGDRFRPTGLNGSQKLKKFFINNKIPKGKRESYPVVVTCDDQVIWIAGLRADERWLVNSNTQKVLILKLVRNITNEIENRVNL